MIMDAAFTGCLSSRWNNQDVNDRREFVTRPFSVIVDDARLWCVTNGKVLVGLRGIEAEPLPHTPGGIEALLRVRNPMRASFDALLAFAGEADWSVETCEICGGARSAPCRCISCDNNHEAPCAACQGTGSVDSVHECAPAFIHLVPVNLRLVARALDGLTAETVGLEIVVMSEKMSALRIVADEWIVVVCGMSLQDNDANFKDAPMFEVPA